MKRNVPLYLTWTSLLLPFFLPTLSSSSSLSSLSSSHLSPLLFSLRHPLHVFLCHAFPHLQLLPSLSLFPILLSSPSLYLLFFLPALLSCLSSILTSSTTFFSYHALSCLLVPSLLSFTLPFSPHLLTSLPFHFLLSLV